MVRLDNCGQCRRAAVLGPPLGGLMECRNLSSKFDHRRRAQPAGLGELVKHQRLIEASHHHDPVDGRAGVPEDEFAFRAAGQRTDLEIEFGGGAPVELELGLARHPAPLGGREIEVGVLHRAFQFVGTVTGEKDERCVGLDDVDPLHRPAIRGWSAEKIDDVALILGHS